jgi:hypothetical protein
MIEPEDAKELLLRSRLLRKLMRGSEGGEVVGAGEKRSSGKAETLKTETFNSNNKS